MTQGAGRKMQQPVVLPGKVTQGRDQRTSGKPSPLLSINTYSVTNREIKTTQFSSGI